jgi:protein-S-isoprenylcysteine O-methyltransferase Ste14
MARTGRQALKKTDRKLAPDEVPTLDTFNWIVNVVVIAGVAYLAFAMALAGWIAGLRRGEAVTLLPARGDGAGTLGRMWGISTSRQVKLLPDHQLIAGGPYALIRHPMYLGWWVALLGALLIYRTWILVLLLTMSLVVFYRRARIEETTLAVRFGAEWQAYVKRTKFLVPFIG